MAHKERKKAACTNHHGMSKNCNFLSPVFVSSRRAAEPSGGGMRRIESSKRIETGGT